MHPLLPALLLSAASGPPMIPADQEPPAASRVTVTVSGDKRVIEANGVPDHKVSRFPNRGNPHEITEQRYRFEVPLKPVPSSGSAPARGPGPGALWGVALNGVVFDPGTAEIYDDGDRSSPWRYEALLSNTEMGTTPRIRTGLGLDANHAHVQPNGAYHYHGLPTLLIERLSGGEKKMTHVGWAADGYPVYAVYAPAKADDAASPVRAMKSSYRLKKTARPGGADAPSGQPDGSFGLDYEYVAGSGDLDAFGGRTGPTPEFPKGTYYYVLTEDWPFIPRAHRGTPDPSFSKRMGEGPGGKAGKKGAPKKKGPPR